MVAVYTHGGTFANVRYPNINPIANPDSNRNAQKLTEQVKHLGISIRKHAAVHNFAHACELSLR